MQIMDVAAADVIKKVAGGEAELGITSGPLEASSLLIEPLFNDRFCVVSAARHDPFEGRTAVGWRELKGRPLIMLSKLTGSRQLIDRALAATETEVQVLQELSLQGSVLPMVEAGIGDSVLPETACPTHDKKFIIRPLIEPAISRPVVMVRKRNRSLAPAASAVWELARSYFPTQAQALFGTTPKTELHIPIAHGGLA
jgi:DNA-binding transcriptional LysR family regulator